MSEYSLYGQRISDTYQRVLQITDYDELLDGSGDTRSLYIGSSLTANTFFIGDSDIFGLFAPIGALGTGATTFLKNGINTFTAGTPTLTSINVTGGTFHSISVTGDSVFNNINATTIFSAGTDLYNVFSTTNTITRVQPGFNTYTGGTSDNPTINISALTVNSVVSSTISGSTYLSGNTNLFDIFNSSLTASTFLQPNVLAIGSSSSGLTYDTRFFLTGNTLHGAQLAFASYMSSGGTSDILFKDFNTGNRHMKITNTNGYVMIGSNAELVNIMPTALLELGSGTTLRSSLRIRSGQTVTNVFDGDIWNDGINLMSYIGGSVHILNSQPTFVQGGINIFTGGTSNRPTINLVESPSVNNIIVSGSAMVNIITATTLQATIIESGATNIDLIYHRKGGYLLQKCGVVSGSTFTGDPMVSNVVFETTFLDNNYAVQVTGELPRIITVENKSYSGFTININDDTIGITENFYWIAMEFGEGYK